MAGRALSARALRYLAPSFHPWRHDKRHPTQRWLHENAGACRPIGRQEPEVPVARPV